VRVGVHSLDLVVRRLSSRVFAATHCAASWDPSIPPACNGLRVSNANNTNPPAQDEKPSTPPPPPKLADMLLAQRRVPEAKSSLATAYQASKHMEDRGATVRGRGRVLRDWAWYVKWHDRPMMCSSCDRQGLGCWWGIFASSLLLFHHRM
jgi:hypothetical protein